MSGGSWDYLYGKDDRLHGGEYAEMAARLDAFPDAKARMLRIAELMTEARATHVELAGIMQAVEWVDSCDWGEESIAKAVAKWREAKP